MALVRRTTGLPPGEGPNGELLLAEAAADGFAPARASVQALDALCEHPGYP